MAGHRGEWGGRFGRRAGQGRAAGVPAFRGPTNQHPSSSSSSSSPGQGIQSRRSERRASLLLAPRPPKDPDSTCGRCLDEPRRDVQSTLMRYTRISIHTFSMLHVYKYSTVKMRRWSPFEDTVAVVPMRLTGRRANPVEEKETLARNSLAWEAPQIHTTRAWGVCVYVCALAPRI